MITHTVSTLPGLKYTTNIYFSYFVYFIERAVSCVWCACVWMMSNWNENSVRNVKHSIRIYCESIQCESRRVTRENKRFAIVNVSFFWWMLNLFPNFRHFNWRLVFQEAKRSMCVCVAWMFKKSVVFMQKLNRQWPVVQRKKKHNIVLFVNRESERKITKSTKKNNNTFEMRFNFY